MNYNQDGSQNHAREPLYSKGAVIAWWLQTTIAQNCIPSCLKGNILVNILLLEHKQKFHSSSFQEKITFWHNSGAVATITHLTKNCKADTQLDL